MFRLDFLNLELAAYTTFGSPCVHDHLTIQEPNININPFIAELYRTLSVSWSWLMTMYLSNKLCNFQQLIMEHRKWRTFEKAFVFNLYSVTSLTKQTYFHRFLLTFYSSCAFEDGLESNAAFFFLKLTPNGLNWK